ncbi:MAG: nucleotidyltransferase family protein [Clostridia bacterium]|nr:nucleotidyltransferase family protein [Clostridia bacterium]
MTGSDVEDVARSVGGPFVSAILLAAGASSRMGTAKQLLMWERVPMVSHVASVCANSRCAEVIVVVGCRADEVREAVLARCEQSGPSGARFRGKPVTVVTNEGWERGMASSVACGAASADPRADAFAIALSDHPAVESSVIDAIILAFARFELNQQGRAVVVPTHNGRRGHPILLGAALRDELIALPGKPGEVRGKGRTLSDIVGENLDVLRGLVEVSSPGVRVDLDTVEEYEAACEDRGFTQRR